MDMTKKVVDVKILMLLFLIFFQTLLLAQEKQTKTEPERLKENTFIYGINFPEGTKIGIWTIFLTDTKKEEYKCFTLEKDIEVNGIKFPKGSSWRYTGTEWDVNLPPSSSILGLEKTTVRDAIVDNEGHLKSVYLCKSAVYEGVKYKKQTYVEFHKSGKVKSGYLAEPQEIQGIKCISSVEFDENGKVIEKWFGIRKEEFKNFKNQPDGFRNIKWGTNISNLKEMEYVRTDWGIEIYIKEDDDLYFEGTEVNKIEYWFWKNNFIGVNIYFKKLNDLEIIKEYCFEKFGSPAGESDISDEVPIFLKDYEPYFQYSYLAYSKATEEYLKTFYWYGDITSIQLMPIARRYISRPNLSLPYEEEPFCGCLTIFSTTGLLKQQREYVETDDWKEKIDKITCLNNLKQIGLALKMYAADHEENFPKKLSELSIYVWNSYNDNLELFTCPVTSIKINTKEEIDEKTGYLYFGANVKPDNYKNIVVCDKEGNHKDCRCVLFADGHVEFLSEVEFQKILEKQR